jgi:hypothetical protein
MFWTHWNLSALRSFYGLDASASQTEFNWVHGVDEDFRQIMNEYYEC